MESSVGKAWEVWVPNHVRATIFAEKHSKNSEFEKQMKVQGKATQRKKRLGWMQLKRRWSTLLEAGTVGT